MLKSSLKVTHFALLMSVLHLLLFHIPFYTYVVNNIDYTSFNGVLLIASLVVVMVVANFFAFYLFLYLSRFVGKFLLVLFFLINAVSVYFITTYGVIIDESMISNVFNTNYEESSSFFSIKLVLYLVLLGILPSIYIVRTKIIPSTFKQFAKTMAMALLFMVVMAFVNASNWLWVDKNSKQLGGLAMPWSYSVNTALYHIHQYKKNEKEILLPMPR